MGVPPSWNRIGRGVSRARGPFPFGPTDCAFVSRCHVGSFTTEARRHGEGYGLFPLITEGTGPQTDRATLGTPSISERANLAGCNCGWARERQAGILSTMGWDERRARHDRV